MSTKKSQNLKISFKKTKNHLFSKNLNTLKNKFFSTKNKKNTIPLVLPFDEISLRPELSSPSRFRIQCRWSERDERSPKDKQTEILVSN